MKLFEKFLSSLDPALNELEILGTFKDQQFDTDSWKSIVNIKCVNTINELFIIDVREAWNPKVFFQNLCDHSWTLNSLLPGNHLKYNRIIIYYCNLSTGIKDRMISQVVSQEFILEKQCENIKHIYIDDSIENQHFIRALQTTTNNDTSDKFHKDKIDCDPRDLISLEKKHDDLITVITIVFNGEDQIERTIQSVINQQNVNIEYIIIDGGSTDRTVEIIKKYSRYINKWISEKDCGIYDAMNKGIDIATGKWLNFMNCGDIFYSYQSLASIPLDPDCDFYYSDTIVHYRSENIRLAVASQEKKLFNHQSMVYRKSLHDKSKYLVHKNITISDYLFFRDNDEKNWCRIITPLAIYNLEGISSTTPTHFIQRLFVDFILGDISELKMSFLIIRKYVRSLVKLVVSWRKS
jgi:hypothetical protein